MGQKKKNPNKIPATQADVKKAMRYGMESTAAIILTVMRDRAGWKKRRLNRLWGWVGDMADSVNKGLVSIAELKESLREENGIDVCWRDK